jgi:hypothetical protein
VGNLSAAMKAEMQKDHPEVYPLLTVSFPGGSKLVSSTAVASASLGLFEGRVLRWDTLRRGVAERTCGLESVDFSVDVSDVDRYFSNLLAGANGHGVRGSAFTLQLGSPNVIPADWFTLWAGVLADWEEPSPLVWTWQFRPNDLALERPFPKTPIGPADWPNASKEARGLWPNLLYGRISISAQGGAISCPLVDITGCRYMVCAGRAKTVLSVFVDKVPVTSGYSITYPVVNGRVYTLIVFTTTQGEAVITADIEGYETVGDGSGALIENPAEQLQHLLVNWIWGDYKTGAWLSASTAPVDTTLFSAAATFLSNRGYKGSRVLGGQSTQQTGLSALEEWCSSLQCQPLWRNNGKLMIKFENPAANPYPAITLDGDRHVVAFGGLRSSSQDLMDRVNLQYLYDHVEGQYTQTLEVRDPSLTHEIPDSLELPWSYGSEAA